MELKVIFSSLSNVRVCFVFSFRRFFINMNQSYVSEITSTFYDRSFVNYFLQYDMVMPSKYDINILYIIRELKIRLISHVSQGNNQIAFFIVTKMF